MKPFKSIVDFFMGKTYIINKNLGGSGTYLLNRVGVLNSRIGRTFFHQSIICCMADAFEYFLEINMTDNIFNQNILSISTQASEKFIKWETTHHTLMFSKGLTELEEITELENALFYIFESTEQEVDKYNDFKEMLSEKDSHFVADFSKAAAGDIFNISEINSLDTSFIYNFYYNCYTEFYRVFMKYKAVKKNYAKDSDNICLSALQASK